MGCVVEPEPVPLAHTALGLQGHVPASPVLGKACEPSFLWVSAKYIWFDFILPYIWSFANLITHRKSEVVGITSLF